MRHLPTKPCYICKNPGQICIRRFGRFWWGKWHWFCDKCAPASIQVLTDVKIPEHSLQEYNAAGNVCHYPGCNKTVEEHPKEVGR